MEKINWNSEFANTARRFGFHQVGDDWGIVDGVSITVLHLQKSQYGDKHFLNINTFFIGYDGQTSELSPNLAGRNGHVFRRQPPEYDTLFTPSAFLDTNDLKTALEGFFTGFLKDYLQHMHGKDSALRYADSGKIFLTPSVSRFLHER